MTGTLTVNEITFNEIQWRSHAVIADASQAIVRVAKQSRIAQRTRREVMYGQVLLSVRSISALMRDLLNVYHAPDAIRALESAKPEDLTKIIDTMHDVHAKVEQTVALIHPTRYWRSLYRPYLESLKAHNDELESHRLAFCAAHSALLLLTPNDQYQLIRSLSEPGKPNAALRRAFGQEQ